MFLIQKNKTKFSCGENNPDFFFFLLVWIDLSSIRFSLEGKKEEKERERTMNTESTWLKDCLSLLADEALRLWTD